MSHQVVLGNSLHVEFSGNESSSCEIETRQSCSVLICTCIITYILLVVGSLADTGCPATIHRWYTNDVEELSQVSSSTGCHGLHDGCSNHLLTLSVSDLSRSMLIASKVSSVHSVPMGLQGLTQFPSSISVSRHSASCMQFLDFIAKQRA